MIDELRAANKFSANGQWSLSNPLSGVCRAALLQMASALRKQGELGDAHDYCSVSGPGMNNAGKLIRLARFAGGHEAGPCLRRPSHLREEHPHYGGHLQEEVRHKRE